MVFFVQCLLFLQFRIAVGRQHFAVGIHFPRQRSAVAFLCCPFSYLLPANFSSLESCLGLDFLFAGFLCFIIGLNCCRKEIPNNNSGKVQNQISVKRNSPCLSLDDGLFYAIVLLIAEQQRLAGLSTATHIRRLS